LFVATFYKSNLKQTELLLKRAAARPEEQLLTERGATCPKSNKQELKSFNADGEKINQTMIKQSTNRKAANFHD
jgi:hypothetical protein